MPHTPIPFDRNVEQWLEYSESPKGRLRHELTWHNLKHHLKPEKPRPRVLDVGCGLGEMASFLLGKAKSLVLLDFSEKMLEKAEQRLFDKHPDLKTDRITFVHGRVEALETCLPKGLFDLILCHTVLEYVDEPRGIVKALIGRLTPGGLISLVAVNSFSEAFRLAILKNDLTKACEALRKREFPATLFGHVPKHTFSLENLEELVEGMNLRILGRYGVRIFTDYVREEVAKDTRGYRLLFDLEKEASKLLPYLYFGRYLHLVCQREGD